MKRYQIKAIKVIVSGKEVIQNLKSAFINVLVDLKKINEIDKNAIELLIVGQILSEMNKG